MNTIGKVTSTRCIARRPRLPRLGSAEPQPERHLSSCQLPARAKLQSAQVLKPRRVPGRTDSRIVQTRGPYQPAGRDSSMCPAAPIPDSQCVALDWSTRHSVQVSRETCSQWLRSGALTSTCRAVHFRSNCVAFARSAGRSTPFHVKLERNNLRAALLPTRKYLAGPCPDTPRAAHACSMSSSTSFHMKHRLDFLQPSR